MKTKKNYIKPDICEYDVVPSAMICQSVVYTLTGNSSEIFVSEDEALGNEHRGSWDDIWSYM